VSATRSRLDLVASTAPVLWERATEVKFTDSEVTPHVDRMFELMRANKGISLAAPQAGIGLRFFVTYAEGLTPVVVNPVIHSEFGGYSSKQEGCLSFPGRLTFVRRAQRVNASWTDGNGNARTGALSGLAARVFQHEVDHLNGICIFQKSGGAK
jgi:peptide deformylase